MPPAETQFFPADLIYEIAAQGGPPPDGFDIVERRTDEGRDREESFHGLVLRQVEGNVYWWAPYSIGLTNDISNRWFVIKKGMVQFTRVYPHPTICITWHSKPYTFASNPTVQM